MPNRHPAPRRYSDEQVAQALYEMGYEMGAPHSPHFSQIHPDTIAEAEQYLWNEENADVCAPNGCGRPAMHCKCP